MPGCARRECRRNDRHWRFADARLGAALALFSIGMLEHFGLGLMMFRIAFPLFSVVFTAQIALETKRLALELITLLTR